MSLPLVVTLGTRTATGATDSFQLGPQDNILFQVTVSSIGTSVVIRFEGSLDGTNWFNLDRNNTDTTLTANGTFGFSVVQTPVAFVRCNLVTINTGTPSVVFKAGLSTAGNS